MVEPIALAEVLLAEPDEHRRVAGFEGAPLVPAQVHATVIGADGNASAVRSFLYPGEAPRFNGQVAFRALVPNDLVPGVVRQRQLAMHPAPRRYLLHYPFGVAAS